MSDPKPILDYQPAAPRAMRRRLTWPLAGAGVLVGGSILWIVGAATERTMGAPMSNSAYWQSASTQPSTQPIGDAEDPGIGAAEAAPEHPQPQGRP